MQATTFEYALLGILDQAPRSGYDLRKGFSTTPLRHYSSSPGSIYPALRRLARRRWIDASDPAGGRGRREFRINPRGRRAFVAWLKTPATLEELITRPQLLMLRFAFMGQALPAADAKRLLDDMERHLSSYVSSLEAFEASAGDAMSLTGRLAFRCGVAEYRHRLRWVREARRALARTRGKP